MDSPWVAVALAIAVFLAVHIVVRIVRWTLELLVWREVIAWNHDGTTSSATSVRIPLPSPGYRISRRGSWFRAERVGPSGDVIQVLCARPHMKQAVRDAWADYDAQSAVIPARDGTGIDGSGLADVDGSLRTA